VPLVGGIDVSTQSTKVVVVDVDDGSVVATGSAPNPVAGSHGHHETDPAAWETAMAAALAATGRAGQLAALSVAAQQHGLVVADDRGPLRPALLWNDTRSAPEAAALVASLGGPGATAALIGSVPSASFTVTKWAWLRAHEADLAEAATSVALPHDHLTYRLTGQRVTDRSDVSGTGWWSPATEDYCDDVLGLAAVDLPRRLLPAVLGPGAPAGPVRPDAADAFGLRASALVGPGAADNAAAALGIGLAPGEMGLSLGTSGTVFAVSGAPSADPSGIVAGFASADGRYLPLACTLNATLAVDRMAAWLGLGREDTSPSDGVVCLPWLDGERTPNVPDATGSLSGLRHDTTPGAILQAGYEGVVATLLAAAGELARWGAQRDDQPIVLIGGGARGPVWQRTVQRLSGRAVVVADVSEPVAYGAAVQAAAALGGVGPAEVTARWPAERGHRLPAVERDEAVLRTIERWRARTLA